MDIPHQFLQIAAFLAYHRLLSVLEELAGASISPVKRYGIPGEQPPHQGDDLIVPGKLAAFSLLIMR